MKTRTDASDTLHVVLLWLPDALHGGLLSTLDVLRNLAMVMQVQRPGRAMRFSWECRSAAWTTVKIPGLELGPLCKQSHAQRDASRTLYVVPGLHVQNSHRIGEIVDGLVLVCTKLAERAAAGAWIAATYTGIAVPAKLGLLDGARFAVPWPHQSWFSRIFPTCDFSDVGPITRHGRIFGCVAPGMQTDFMLRVVADMGFSDLADACRPYLLYQAQHQELIPGLVRKKWTGKTADSPVYRAMQWLDSHVEEPYSLAALTRVAVTSERTLLRHFQQVVGMTPLDYLQDLRVKRAKMLLQVTLHTVHTIAQSCGYSDATLFRRIFRSATGMTPTEFRTRYALRARRRHWRVEAAV